MTSVAASAGKDSNGVTLRVVEALIAEDRKDLRMPPWLEARLESDNGARYNAALRRCALKGAFLYNIFIVGDLFLTPDRVGLAVCLHLLVVTPALIGLAWLLRYNRGSLFRDIVAGIAPVLIVVQILASFLLSESPNAYSYLYFVLMTTVCANTAMRLSYRAAQASTIVNMILLGATLGLTQRMAPELAAMQFLSFAACAFITLRSNYDHERERHRAFVRGLRDRLQVEAIDEEASQDALTGIANRRHLDQRAAEIWADPDNSPIAAILFDVDRFKAFNDLYGHPAGDSCLKRVAACATAELRRTDDLVVRYGGEEFLLILPRTDLADAQGVAERIRRAILALRIAHKGNENLGIVTASFGVASMDRSLRSYTDLISAADSALYDAKRAGRNRVSPVPDLRWSSAQAVA